MRGDVPVVTKHGNIVHEDQYLRSRPVGRFNQVPELLGRDGGEDARTVLVPHWHLSETDRTNPRTGKAQEFAALRGHGGGVERLGDIQYGGELHVDKGLDQCPQVGEGGVLRLALRVQLS